MAVSVKTKLGVIIAVAVIAGLTSTWLSVLLLIVAAFLIAWGQAPKGTEELGGWLPYGNHLLKALAQLDVMLPRN